MNHLTKPMKKRILEAYVGEYASGKSELAVNRSLQLKRQGRPVRLVDLDLVEPFYTLRPLKKRLQQSGIDVIAWDPSDALGFGEAAIPLKAEAVNAFNYIGDVILDIGYGHQGRNVLRLIEDYQNTNLEVFMVVNISRPLTSSPELIIRYVQEFGKVDGLINNTHLGDETTVSLVQKGSRIVTEAARKLNLPIIATSVLETFASSIGPLDIMGNKVWTLDRWMKNAIW